MSTRGVGKRRHVDDSVHQPHIVVNERQPVIKTYRQLAPEDEEVELIMRRHKVLVAVRNTITLEPAPMEQCQPNWRERTSAARNVSESSNEKTNEPDSLKAPSTPSIVTAPSSNRQWDERDQSFDDPRLLAEEDYDVRAFESRLGYDETDDSSIDSFLDSIGSSFFRDTMSETMGRTRRECGCLSYGEDVLLEAFEEPGRFMKWMHNNTTATLR